MGKDHKNDLFHSSKKKTRKQRESEENIQKHKKTGRIKEKHTKPWENRGKRREIGEIVEKDGKTGRIRGNHRKTRENREDQGKTFENHEKTGETYKNTG